MEQSSVRRSLDRTRALVASLCEEAGVPGLALGVIHNDRVVHEQYHGYRDVESRLPVDQNTVFHVASLTKAMTATALGILVERGRIPWDTPIHDILPAMSKTTALYEATLNVKDLLSHRTGKAWADALYLQSNNRILLAKDQSVRTFDSLAQVAPVRNKYMYNNHAYNLAGLVIEKICGQEWSQFMTENIFKRLGMDRTYTEHPTEEENIAIPYNILRDRSPFRVPFCNVSGKTMMFAGQSVRTSVADLLKYSSEYLGALKAAVPSATNSNNDKERDNGIKLGAAGLETSGTTNTTKSEPIVKQVATLVRPHVSRSFGTLLEQKYALGWNRTQLPGTLDFGWNQQVLQPFPVLGEKYPGRLAIWHSGNMPGATSAICLLPETGTTVVVLQNSLGLCDVADWVCQLTIDTIFTGNPACDYVPLIKRCVDKGVARMDEVEVRLEGERVHGTKPRPLGAYTRRYYNHAKIWFIDIKLVDGELVLEFLGRLDERYNLRHYHYDTFVWNLPYDDLVKRAQYIRPYTYYRLEFEGKKSMDRICRIRWRHDQSVPEGEVFEKSG